ncbi:winged helix-turn-helix transcriptional regulator [Catenulispora rubra]|uniref:winged helix-turn-helix transcriptional regulator n=1 Tax=Catenulispora rubra TaxID=280293 RepID=UPI0018927E9E|nr:winged helix-turn-helix transcriptional regulator [Catenulispora rubra]
MRGAVVGLRWFGDFQKSLGIAIEVFATWLCRLCDEGILARRPDPERPGWLEYILTDTGPELTPLPITFMG